MTLPTTQPPAAAAQVRALYAAGLPIAEIIRRTGIRYGMIYYWIDREIGPDGTVTLNPHTRRKGAECMARDLGAGRRRKLANRMWRAAEAQVGEIETRLSAFGTAPAEAERDARALAVLARVVRELAALDAVMSKKSEPSRDEDARGPIDLDTFRRELARRLDGLRGDGPD